MQNDFDAHVIVPDVPVQTYIFTFELCRSWEVHVIVIEFPTSYEPELGAVTVIVGSAEGEERG